MEKMLCNAMSDSISNEVGGAAEGLLEVGLDALMDDGLLKEVPILSTVVSVYKIGHTLKERHQIRKLASFISALNNKVASEEQREKYKRKVTENAKQRNHELEYILLLIDRYINSEKADILAKLYLSYLDEKLTWFDFTKYAEVLDRFLPGDLSELKLGYWPEINDQFVSDSLLRLVSLGLVVFHNTDVNIDNTVGTLVIPEHSSKVYEMTEFGSVFLDCILH